jgi:hypothetical protein
MIHIQKLIQCTIFLYATGFVHSTFDVTAFSYLEGMIPFQAHLNSTVGNFGSERRSTKSLAFVTALLRGPKPRAASHTCRMSARGWKLDPGSRSLRSSRASLRILLRWCLSRRSNKVIPRLTSFVSVQTSSPITPEELLLRAEP